MRASGERTEFPRSGPERTSRFHPFPDSDVEVTKVLFRKVVHPSLVWSIGHLKFPVANVPRIAFLAVVYPNRSGLENPKKGSQFSIASCFIFYFFAGHGAPSIHFSMSSERETPISVASIVRRARPSAERKTFTARLPTRLILRFSG